MRRRLSSRLTLFYKCFPVFWTAGWAVGTYCAFAGEFRDDKGDPAPLWGCCVLLVVTVVSSIGFFRIHGRLKSVWLEDGWLCVSNYLLTDRVSLTEIQEVCWHWDSKPGLITVRFIRNCLFGREIQYLPPG